MGYGWTGEVQISDTCVVSFTHSEEFPNYLIFVSYLRDTAACVVVFDLSSKESFNSVRSWVDQVRDEKGSKFVGECHHAHRRFDIQFITERFLVK